MADDLTQRLTPVGERTALGPNGYELNVGAFRNAVRPVLYNRWTVAGRYTKTDRGSGCC